MDLFLQKFCSKTGLHKLHKELGLYIKYLQSLMIDIVNAESSAIVNLSSELKVLQNKFFNIANPLGQFKEEVSLIYKIIDTNLQSIKNLLEQKEHIASVKATKINELRILISSHKISGILELHIEDKNIDMEILERSVDQYILQQMYCQNCNIQEFTSQTNHSTDVLNQMLNNTFLNSLLQKNTEHIVRCLQMYMMMNTQNIAEQLYGQKVVRPALLKIINQEKLTSCKGDVSEIYALITDFIKSDMSYLLNIVHKSNAISGFNFLLNSVWVQVYELLKLNLATIYAPGNPHGFHLRFTQTCAFLTQFEQHFLDSSERNAFRQHCTYAAHRQLWNLPIYFEIRYMEVLINLHHSLPKRINSTIFAEQIIDEFKLVPSISAWNALRECFARNVYLTQLLNRFWKLHLQVLSQYSVWIQGLFDKVYLCRCCVFRYLTSNFCRMFQ